MKMVGVLCCLAFFLTVVGTMRVTVLREWWRGSGQETYHGGVRCAPQQRRAP